MKKHKSFIGRLLWRNKGASCEAGDKPDQDITNEPLLIDADSMAAQAEATQGPTMCKGGKLYKARLRNGRWETVGPPIGKC